MKTQYRPGVGVHISDACREAVAFARQAAESQTFTFNDVTITAHPDSDPGALVSSFHAQLEADLKAWRESPEGRQHAENRRLELIRKQATHDALVNDLPNVLKADRDALMRWASSYAEVADDIGIVQNREAVIAALEGAGYVANQATGLPKAEYQRPAIMAAYIIGQALSCMKNGMPPHQMTMTFVERYFALSPRFQVCRWPDSTPEFQGVLYVVDTQAWWCPRGSRIVREYSKGDAFADATRDAAAWNADPTQAPDEPTPFQPISTTDIRHADGSVHRTPIRP